MASLEKTLSIVGSGILLLVALIAVGAQNISKDVEIKHLKEKIAANDSTSLQKALVTTEIYLEKLKTDYKMLSEERDLILQRNDALLHEVEVFKRQFQRLRIISQSDEELKIAREPIVTDPKQCK